MRRPGSGTWTWKRYLAPFPPLGGEPRTPKPGVRATQHGLLAGPSRPISNRRRALALRREPRPAPRTAPGFPSHTRGFPLRRFILRRAKNPTSPVATNTMVEGSGSTVTGGGVGLVDVSTSSSRQPESPYGQDAGL